MKFRTLGKTNFSVSEIGFGAWGIGGSMWKGVEDNESIRTVHAALDRGINFYDTALAYGDGHSERLLGQIKKNRPEEMIVATKVPPKNYIWPAKPGSNYRDVFPMEYIIECTHTSLKNLGTDCVDLQQLHVWLDDWAGIDDIWEAAERLKKDGKIRAFGISINDHQPENSLKALATGNLDTVQVIYNIFDQSPEDELLPFCQKNNIGVIARVPFDEGGLTGMITPETGFPERDWRNDYFRGDRKQQVFDRITAMKPLLGEEARDMAELALRYILDNSAVSSVIPGMRRIKNVEANTAVSDGKKLSAGLRSELKKHRWVRNFYDKD